MRKTLLALTALAALVGAGVASTASASPLPLNASLVQPVQYYYGGYPHEDWRAREWRHREWERHRHWEEWHRYHHHW